MKPQQQSPTSGPPSTAGALPCDPTSSSEALASGYGTGGNRVTASSAQSSSGPHLQSSVGPPHQIIINSPSPEASPSSPRNTKRPTPLTAISAPLSYLGSTTTRLPSHTSSSSSKLSPISPMYPTSDLGSSPRSSLSVSYSASWQLREQKRGSSSDFTDPDSEASKDLFSPGLMLSPAPFSPFSEGPETSDASGTAGSVPIPGHAAGSLAGAIRTLSAVGQLAARERSTNKQLTIPAVPAHRYRFTFDKCSASATNLLLKPAAEDNDSLERSSSDSEVTSASRQMANLASTEADGSLSAVPSPVLSGLSFSGSLGRGRGKAKTQRPVKKRFLERFISNQQTASSEPGIGCDTQETQGLSVGLVDALRFDTNAAPTVSRQKDAVGHRSSPIISVSSAEPFGSIVPTTQPASASDQGRYLGVIGHAPIRLSLSSMEIGGFERRFEVPRPRTAPVSSQSQHADSSADSPKRSPLSFHSPVQKSKSATPYALHPHIECCPGQSFQRFQQEQLQQQQQQNEQAAGVSDPVANVRQPHIIPHGPIKDFGQMFVGSPVGNQPYFDWWLRQQVATASQLWPQGRSQPYFPTTPSFTVNTPFDIPPPPPPAGRVAAGLPDTTRFRSPTRSFLSTRHYSFPYPVLKGQRSRSESDVSYICPFCNQTFALHDRLAKHIATRHRDRSVSVTTATTAESIGTKPHLCLVCKKSFSRTDMLTRHMRLHTGIRPYACATCGQVFSRSDHLSTHQRTHTGEKPYACPQCAYTASRRDMITRHMRTHVRAAAMQNKASTCNESSGESPPIGNRRISLPYRQRQLTEQPSHSLAEAKAHSFNLSGKLSLPTTSNSTASLPFPRGLLRNPPEFQYAVLPEPCESTQSQWKPHVSLILPTTSHYEPPSIPEPHLGPTASTSMAVASPPARLSGPDPRPVSMEIGSPPHSAKPSDPSYQHFCLRQQQSLLNVGHNPILSAFVVPNPGRTGTEPMEELVGASRSCLVPPEADSQLSQYNAGTSITGGEAEGNVHGASKPSNIQ